MSKRPTDLSHLSTDYASKVKDKIVKSFNPTAAIFKKIIKDEYGAEGIKGWSFTAVGETKLSENTLVATFEVESPEEDGIGKPTGNTDVHEWTLVYNLTTGEIKINSPEV